MKEIEFCKKFAYVTGFDDDEITEIVMSISAIRGMYPKIEGDTLSYNFILGNDSFALITFSLENPFVTIDTGDLMLFLETHGRFPFEADEFITDTEKYIDGTSVGLEMFVEQPDDFVLAIHRLMFIIYS